MTKVISGEEEGDQIRDNPPQGKAAVALTMGTGKELLSEMLVEPGGERQGKGELQITGN